MKKLISIVTPCYNEEDNVQLLSNQVQTVFASQLPNYDYEHIFIDNASTDATVSLLKKLAADDKRIKLIINSRNFGHIRSPVHGIFQAQGDAVISLVADLQDPPDMIPELIQQWELGHDTVLAIKKDSDENSVMFKLRKMYYRFLARCAEIKIYKNFTGFGLYSRRVIESLRQLQDPYPFFRGMIAEVGFSIGEIQYHQPTRFRGVTKNNFYSLYDIGMLGIMNNSKLPLRFLVLLGVFFGTLSLFVGIGYFIAKLIYWDHLSLGVAPLIIGGSLAFSIIIFFLGIIGEYIGAIYTQVLNRPLVFEQERINF